MSEFKLNDMVIPISCPPKYEKNSTQILHSIGQVGAIFRINGVTFFGVKFDKLTNKKSKQGLLWFSGEYLTLYKNTNKENKEDKTMIDVTKFDKGAKFAILTNPAKPNDSGTVGVYYTDLKMGDIVVCDYHYGNKAMSARLVELTEVDPETIALIDCEIIGVCDATDYLARKKKAARRVELKKQMLERAKKYQEEEYWRLLAEKDPEMAMLYDEFTGLDK